MQTVSAWTNTHGIDIDITFTSSPLDESLTLIKQFLVTRLATSVQSANIPGRANVVIDIAMLGISGMATIPAKRAEGTIIYPIRLRLANIILGPLYPVGLKGAPCPHCLERRWLAIRSEEELQAHSSWQKTCIFGAHPGLHPAALEMVWQVVEAELYGATPALPQGWLYRLQPDSLRLTRHQLLADSSCPLCAQPQVDAPAASSWQLTTRPKHGYANYRLAHPLDYALPQEGYINPVCGMIGKEVEVDLRHTVTAPVTGQFTLCDIQGRSKVWWEGHSSSFRLSQRIGLLEGLERYCGHWPRTRERVVIDSYANLASDALDPRTCGLYSPETYRAHAPHLQPFDPRSKISWMWGYSFRQGRPLLVPEQLAYYFPQLSQEAFFVYDCSNGCAIGSCMEEAILHGLLELIERDSFLLSWYARLAPPRLDPWSSSNPTTLRLLDRITRLGYDVSFLDTRFDLPIPSLIALAQRRETGLGTLVVAAGAHLDPEEAIRAALCEVAAYLPCLPQRVEQRLDELKAMLHDYTRVTSIEQHALLYGLPEMAEAAAFLLQNPHQSTVAEGYEQWNEQRPRHDDLRDDLLYCIDTLAAQGIDTIVVDQTAPELTGTGLHVVRVLAPGLLPIDFGWGRQRVSGLPRLRTVPRLVQACETDFDLSLLNRIPHPFP